jgi:hypothetical protein
VGSEHDGGYRREIVGAEAERGGGQEPTSWEDESDAHCPEDAHAVETVHIILAGEMTLTMRKVTTYRTGERCDVRAGTVHSAQKGPRGCRYLIGER